jgi:glycosyltransferase involved in cell wall biosynthesis
MLTVLLASHNGVATLPVVLESYCRLEEPPGGWKVVLVDNDSTDTTQAVVAAFADRLPLEYVFEGRPGKNVALNTGLKSVTGDLVVFTDDDTVPRPDWLVRLREAADSHPDFGVFGGPVEPRWEVPPPCWVHTAVPLGPTYTISETWLAEGPVSAFFVFGPNMAVRRGVFDSGVRFNPAIGPRPGRSYPMGSETEFLIRVSAGGVGAWYDPNAVVEHMIRARQLRLRWILGRAVRFGRGQYLLHLLLPEHVGAGWGFETSLGPSSDGPSRGSRIVAQLVQKSRQVAAAIVSLDRSEMVRAGWRVGYASGYFREMAHRVYAQRIATR